MAPTIPRGMLLWLAYLYRTNVFLLYVNVCDTGRLCLLGGTKGEMRRWRSFGRKNSRRGKNLQRCMMRGAVFGEGQGAA